MSTHCPSCHKELTDDCIDGLCPKCLLKNLLVPDATVIDNTETLSSIPDDQGASNETLGDYEIIGEIARGGMGVVYRARQVSLDRIVALKLIRDGRLATLAEAQRFRIEAVAAAELDHPNIVSVYEVGEDSGQHYYSMRHVRGGSLADHVKDYLIDETTSKSSRSVRTSSTNIEQKKGWKGADAAAAMMLKIARAVQFAHQHGILHRDLKPANILIDDEGEPHVSDFGLAKRLDRESDLTMSGQVLGSPSYMAPEQAEGERNLTTATDTYALGAILYHLLAQRPPFLGDSPMMVINQLTTQEPEAPRKLNHRIPRDLETVCLRALQKDPQKRYASAKEFGDDLERFLQREPISARPVGSAERLALWVRRNPRIAGLVGLVLGMLFIIAVGSFIFAVNLDKSKRATQRELAQNIEITLDLEKSKGETQRELAQNLIFLGSSKSKLDRDVVKQLPRFYRAYTVAAEHPQLRASALNLLGGWASTVGKCFYNGEPIVSLGLSPDGTRMITGDEKGKVRVWDTATGLPMDTDPNRHKESVHQIEFSPDGKLFATASEDHTVGVWVSETGEPHMPKINHDHVVMNLVFSADSKLLVTASIDKTCQFTDLENGKEYRPPLVFDNPVIAVDLHADGKRLAVACQNVAPAVLDIGTGDRLHETLGDPEQPVKSVLFSPAGDLLLVAYLESNGPDQALLRLFDSQSGDPIPVGSYNPRSRTIHYGNLTDFVFTKDGKGLLTAGRGGRVRFLEKSSAGWTYEPVLGSDDDTFLCVDLSPDGKWIAMGMESGVIHLIDRAELSKSGPDRHSRTFYHRGPVRDLEFLADGATLASASTDGTARLWETRPWQEFESQTGLDPGVAAASVAFPPDRDQVLVIHRGRGSREFPAALQSWNLTSGQVGEILQSYPPSSSFALASDAASAFRGTLHGEIEQRSVQGGLVGQRFPSQGHSVVALCPTPNSDRLMVANNFDREGIVYDLDLSVWNIKSGELLGKLTGHTESTAVIATNPQGTLAASGSLDGKARLWDLNSLQPHGTPLGHQDRVDGVCFSDDGSLVATASADGTARVWDVESSEAAGEPLVHSESVRSVVFSRDGKSLISASSRSLRLWDIHTSEPLGPPFAANKIGLHLVALVPGESAVLSFREDGIPRKWPLPSRVLDEPERVRLWVEQLSGFDANTGKPLQFDDWLAKRRRLDSLGGPPLADR